MSGETQSTEAEAEYSSFICICYQAVVFNHIIRKFYTKDFNKQKIFK
jgi:hypothetical protein